MDAQRVTRAKFRVNRKARIEGADGQTTAVEVTLNPIYGGAPGTEDHDFWTATPSGTLTMYITNPAAFGALANGASYYLDLTPAPS